MNIASLHMIHLFYVLLYSISGGIRVQENLSPTYKRCTIIPLDVRVVEN